MTDEARIARLTQLARRVWPEERGVHVTRHGNYLRVMTLPPPNVRVLASVSHARPYDALEAALLVLADEERVPLTERRVFEDRIGALERDRATLVRRYKDRELEQAAWVEQLASEWEERSYEMGGGNTIFAQVARELRARAKGET